MSRCAGSYIFSQCLLALQGGTASRAGGYTIAGGQLLTFLLPVSLVHLLPNFYYGALLVLIGSEIVVSWLFETFPRVSAAEFALSWATFLSVVALCAVLPVQGLEAGLLVGVALCALHFAYEYSVMQLVTFTVLPSRSHAALPFPYQQALSLFRGHMAAVSVSGAPHIHACCCRASMRAAAATRRGQMPRGALHRCCCAGYIFFGSMVEIARRLRQTAASLQAAEGCPTDTAAALHLADTRPGDGAPVSAAAATAAAQARATAHRFLLLDLRHVTGIDATTACSFASLSRSLANRCAHTHAQYA
jgi:MFS superfamily sulfate permease-like transporter